MHGGLYSDGRREFFDEWWRRRNSNTFEAASRWYPLLLRIGALLPPAIECLTTPTPFFEEGLLLLTAPRLLAFDAADAERRFMTVLSGP